MLDDKYTTNVLFIYHQAIEAVLDGSGTNVSVQLRTNPLLYEILRSFNTLAETLNLSHAVRDLGSTRQTVRRHISQLEEIKGGSLFSVEERQYKLTDLGLRILPEVQDLLARADGWVNDNASLVDGLQYLQLNTPDGWSLYQQQKPIGLIFESKSSMLRDVMAAWVASRGEIEHEAMQAVRPLLMVFRRSEEKWLCVELGEESSYVSWFGWAAARSSIGRELGQMPGGVSFGRLVNIALSEVETNRSIRLDHTYTQFRRGPDGPFVPICYERLLLASRFPDGSFALLSVVRRTYDVEIDMVTNEMLRGMPEELLM